MNVFSFFSGDSLMRLLQGAAIGFVLAVAIGFNWAGPGFGWVTGGTAEKIESWKRRDELSKESTTLPGGSYQSSDLVDACSAEILKPQVAAVR